MSQPAILAKSVATLDVITKGRVELGLEAGWFWDAVTPNGYLAPEITPAGSLAAIGVLIIRRGRLRFWTSTRSDSTLTAAIGTSGQDPVVTFPLFS